MALVTVALGLIPTYTPYERPPQPVTLWSAIPRGLQSFTLPQTALTAKPINDDELITLTATIPPNYGYVFADSALHITQDVASDWDPFYTINLQNFYRAPLSQSVALSLVSNEPFETSGFGTVRAGAAKSTAFSYPIIGSPGTTGIQINIQATNGANPAGATGTLQAVISFWQFDLEQVRKFPINSPIPTNSR